MSAWKRLDKEVTVRRRAEKVSDYYTVFRQEKTCQCNCAMESLRGMLWYILSVALYCSGD